MKSVFIRLANFFINLVQRFFQLAGGYNKYLGKEDHLQHQVMQYIAAQYPFALATHIANEGRRSPFERFKFKHLGAKAGIPDILIFDPNAKYNGLAIELKAGKNKPTPAQKEWLEELEVRGWAAMWLNDFDKVVDVLKKYFMDEL
jgi:hypothetical protein